MFYKFKAIRLFVLCFLLAFSLNVRSEDIGVKVLFIGNSFTSAHKLTNIENNLVRAAGINAYISSYLSYGKSVDYFIHDTLCWQKIKSAAWDFIVIQDNQRYYSGPRRRLDSFGKRIPLLNNNLIFQNQIKKLIPCVKIIYFAGWEQEGGVPLRFKNDNTLKMIDRILYNYKYMNSKTGVNNVIAPIGVAWKSAISQRPEMAKKPYNDYYLYDKDGRHPGHAGSYLAAYVLFITLFHQSPVGLTNKSNISGKELDTFLKKIAWQAVMDSFGYTNLATVSPEIKSDGISVYTSTKFSGYQWFDEDTIIPGANSYKYKPATDKMTYQVQVVDKKGCVFVSFPYRYIRKK